MNKPKTPTVRTHTELLQTFHVTVTNTIARTYEVEADNKSNAAMYALGYGHPDTVPVAVRLLGQDIEVDQVD